MKVLVACEFSGVVRDAFIRRGHDAMSCDLLETESPGPHYRGDVRDVLGDQWDLMIAHPPCTYICSSGLHHNVYDPFRRKCTEEALKFVETLMNAPIPLIAIENPVGCISTRIRPPEQIIQPYHYGHDASKSTCLWLKCLKSLLPGKYILPRLVGPKKLKRWANQTDSGQNAVGPSDLRMDERATTYLGIAEAMAEQWGQSSGHCEPRPTHFQTRLK